MTNTKTDKRFLNFPLSMLGRTITDPKDGLNKILDYAIVDYSRHCRRTWKQAFAQIVYCRCRNKDVGFSAKVDKLLRRPDVKDFLGGYTEGGSVVGDCFAAGGYNPNDGAHSRMIEAIDDSGIEFNDAEQAAIVDCMAVIDAAHYLGFTIVGSIDGINEGASKSRLDLEAFQGEHGGDAPASVPVEYFKDILT